MNANRPIDQPVAPHAPRTFADIIGLSATTRMLRRRWPIMLLLGLIAAGATFAFIMSRTPSYTAISLLIVTPHETPQQAGAAGAGSAAIDSEIELLRSPALMDDVADALGMRGARNAAPTEGVVSTITKAIAVNRRGQTNVVEISAQSGDPRRAQQLANAYADVYIANQLRAHVDTSQQSNSWLARRLAELRDAAEAKEAAAEAFRAQAGLPAEDAPVEAPVGGDPRSQIQLAQADLDERQARSNRLRGLVSSGGSVDSIATAAGSETLNGLRDRMRDIDHRQGDLENRYLPTHPAVIAIRAERADVEAQIQHEIQRVSDDLASQVAAARGRLQELQRTLRASPDVQTGSPDNAARLRDLRREASVARQVYETYLQRNQDMEDINRLNIPDTRVLAYAPIPMSPAWPRLPIALELALAIGLALAIAFGVIAELFDQSVKNADDLENKVGCAAIASIPSISERMMHQMPPAERHPSGYLVGRPMSAFAEALRVLRTVIVYSRLDAPVRVVAITSALPGEGKTTVSMCLARVAAMSGQRICVVDCDLRMQSINDVIDIETDVGILQVLAGEAPWRSAIVHDPNSDAHVLPVATSGFTPRDVFGSDAMARLIGDLRAHYDLVILDCAPILAVAETRILVKQADVTVLVARSGKTPVGALRAAVSQTELAGGTVLGAALNCVLPHWQTYSDSIYFNQSKSYNSVG